MVRMLPVYFTNGRFPDQTNDFKEKFGNIKGAIEEGQKTTKGKMSKKLTIIEKLLHIKLKIEQQEPHYKPVVNSGALDG